MSKLRLFVFSTDDKRFEEFKTYETHKHLTIVRITDVSTVADAYKWLDDDYLADYNLFVHDDVRFLKDINEYIPLIEHIYAQNKNVVIGVAGAKNYSKSIAWWDKKNDVCGAVTHAKDGRQWTTTYGPLNKEYNGYKYDYTQVVDGLFLMVSKEFYMERKPFESAFNNHFYDIRACFSADHCVVIDFPVIHYSIGELTEGYDIEAKRLMQDYWDGTKFKCLTPV
jgi:hypothetical protein